jgi:hypothetical protein
MPISLTLFLISPLGEGKREKGERGKGKGERGKSLVTVITIP